MKTAKIHFKTDWSKEKRIEKRQWRVYTLFYKDLFSNLNDIKNSNSKYESKRCQRKKENLLSLKEKKFEINIKKKNIEKIKIYYTLIKHSINVQALIEFNNYSIR